MQCTEICELNMLISLLILRSCGTTMQCTLPHLHMVHSKFTSKIRHILPNSFPTSSFAGSICKHCIPQVYVWSHTRLWLRIRSQIGCWLESLIFWLVYTLRNLSEKSSNVRHENILHLLMTKMMKIHMLMKKMFCYHLWPNACTWPNPFHLPSLYINFKFLL